MPLVNISREEYDAIDRVNWSMLKHIDRSPLHYRHAKDHGRKDTDALKNGRASHLAILEPERFGEECATWGGGVRRGKEWDAFRAQNVGRNLLTQAETDRCLALSAAVRRNPDARRYLAKGVAEATILWECEASFSDSLPAVRVPLKSRLDFVSEAGALVDVKTTRNAGQEDFGRAVWRYRYHTQAAFYADAYAHATGTRLPFVIVAVEVDAPHVVQVYRVPESVLDVGRDEYRALLGYLAKCQHESRWPGYSDGELELTLPNWAYDFGYGDEDLGELGLVIGGAEA